jgi:hypothetical protein
MEKEKAPDLRVKVKFVEKPVKVTDEKERQDKTMIEFYKGPDGIVRKPGDEVLTTRKQAKWLAHNGFIESLKKENKQAAKRETK